MEETRPGELPGDDVEKSVDILGTMEETRPGELPGDVEKSDVEKEILARLPVKILPVKILLRSGELPGDVEKEILARLPVPVKSLLRSGELPGDVEKEILARFPVNSLQTGELPGDVEKVEKEILARFPVNNLRSGELPGNVEKEILARVPVKILLRSGELPGDVEKETLARLPVNSLLRSGELPGDVEKETLARLPVNSLLRSVELPGDVEKEILVRLPVKSLLRFKCACKPWYSLISSHQFQRSHFLHSQNKPLLLTTVRDKTRSSVLHLFTYKNINESSNVSDFPITVPPIYSSLNVNLIQSCLGLVCLATEFTRFIIVCNPSTQEVITLPKALGSFEAVGLGYATRAQEFKVFTFSYMQSCHVFTLGTSEWRVVKESLPFRVNKGSAPFLHGAVHFLPHRYSEADDSKYIVAFDVDSEEYKGVPLPGCYRSITGSNQVELMALTELGGLLCLSFHLRYVEGLRLEMWLLKDYNSVKWLKRCIINFSSLTSFPTPLSGKPDQAYPVGIMGNKSIMLNFRMEEFWYYDLQDKIGTKKIDIHGPTSFYAESLFPLQRQAGLTQALIPLSSEAIVETKEKDVDTHIVGDTN